MGLKVDDDGGGSTNALQITEDSRRVWKRSNIIVLGDLCRLKLSGGVAVGLLLSGFEVSTFSTYVRVWTIDQATVNFERWKNCES
mmetsp:Transcript_6924/g.13938  ORF Transcript_6924/g.13938 Transcript_6924/m.13938 type:complete len:85 (-) Transcript_6924:21-275(-)